MSHGIERIAIERNRQVLALKWTPQHDRRHIGGALADMAMVYIDPANNELPWPRPDWDKDGDDRGAEHFREHLSEQRRGHLSNRIEHLTKAGALIAAEIDRLTAIAFDDDDFKGV